MPIDPHPITVTVNQDDNSTAQVGATVLVRNTTKETELVGTSTTNSSGVAMLDLQNLPAPEDGGDNYNDGDKILIIAHYKNQHDAIMYTVTGNSKDQTLNLNPAKYWGRRSTIKNIITAETANTVAYCRIWDYTDGELIAQIETPASDTKDIRIEGGIERNYVIERESSDLIVSVINR